MSAVDSVTPFAWSYIIYFSQLSCQSLFEEHIGRGKKSLRCIRRLFGRANFDLPVPLSWQKAIGVEGWQAHQNKNQRLEAMLFKESHHDQKSNRNTRCCLLSTVRGRKKMKARGSNVWKASLSLADLSRKTSQRQQLRETERQPRPT